MDEAAGGVTFRAHRSEDLNFLMDSWGSSYKAGSRAHKRLTAEEFHAFHRPIRERFFSRSTACVIVACMPDDEWYIMGWIAVEKIASGMVLQYLYTRATAKREGIASDLIARALHSRPVFYTHLTEQAAKIIDRDPRLDGFIHIPHLV